MSKNIHGSSMTQNIYGPSMAKNILGPAMAKYTFSFHYSQSNWGDKQKIHENLTKNINLEKRGQSSAHA